MTDAIDVRGLNKSFGDKHVVRDVSIRVGEGRITGFLGPNGAGKTTTLRLLCGLLTPDSGEGEVLGTRQSGAPGFRLASLPEHAELLRLARAEAQEIVAHNPRLEGAEGDALRILLYLFERDAAVRLLQAG